MGRKQTDETKRNISQALLDYNKKNPRPIRTNTCEKCGKEFQANIRLGRKIHCSKCKRKVVHRKDINMVNNLYDFSTATISKILHRIGIKCSICGWNKASCDLHHIIQIKDGGGNEHTNLTCVCPNCHREIHSGSLTPKMNLEEQIGDSWKKYYAVSNCLSGTNL